MKLARRTFLSALLALALVLPFVPVKAQSTAAKRPMDIEDVIAFRNMGTTTLSNDGQWMVYSMRPTQGDTELIVRSTATDKEMKFPVGDGGGNSAVFSDDSQWIAFSTSAKKADADAARRAPSAVRPPSPKRCCHGYIRV